jgi:hypothetical protein
MKGGLGNMMKQAQQLQANLQKAQEELANLEVTGESGGGMVQVVMNGRHDVRRVSIDAAVNDAVRKVERTTQERMAGLTAGLGLPGGLKLPF